MFFFYFFDFYKKRLKRYNLSSYQNKFNNKMKKKKFTKNKNSLARFAIFSNQARSLARKKILFHIGYIREIKKLNKLLKIN